jgi:hypothetical protein
MAGLVPANHAAPLRRTSDVLRWWTAWMAGTSPAMTSEGFGERLICRAAGAFEFPSRRCSGREESGHEPPFASTSSITLTCAATIRQPSGKRTQVCICRPILPGALSRRNKVAAIAKSWP